MSDTNPYSRYAALIEAIRDALDVHPSIEHLLGGTPQAWHNVGRALGFIADNLLDTLPRLHIADGQQAIVLTSAGPILIIGGTPPTNTEPLRARPPIALGVRYRFATHPADEIVTPYKIEDDHVHYILADGGYDGSCRAAYWHENTTRID